MNPEITKIIEQYLANELSPADKIAFEQRLKTNEKLQTELQLQKDIHSASARLHQKTTIQKIGRKRHFRKWMFRAGMFVVVASLLTAGSIFFVNDSTSENTENYAKLDNETEVKLDETIAFSNLPVQRYEIPKDGKVVLSKKGVLISVPENAFLKDGKPYSGKVIVQYQEAISGSDVVKAGLSTMSGDRLLETGGMFAVEGFTEDGESLEFNPEVGVYIQAPMTDNNTEMQLFDGVKLADGTIDWQNPEELEKIPVPVDMSQLDFYPEKYEPKLDELKWKKNKKSRDSLYLSFDDSENNQISGAELFSANCANCHHPTKDGTGPKLQGVRNVWKQAGAGNVIYDWVQNWQVAAQESEYARVVSEKIPSSMPTFPELTKTEIDAILDWVDSYKTPNINTASATYCPSLNVNLPETRLTREEINYLYNDNRPSDENMTCEEFKRLSEWKEGPRWHLFFSDYYYRVHPEEFETATDSRYIDDEVYEGVEGVVEEASECCYLSPSKVLGFWKKKFNNTNLATREFEERMIQLHNIGEDFLMEKYIKNLDKRISEIDSQIAALGYSKFKSFAAEKIGKVDVSNAHIKNLQAFYEGGVKALKEQNERYQKEQREKDKKWDKKVAKSRQKNFEEDLKRKSDGLQEEFEYNLNDVYRQLGKTRGFTVNHGGGTIKNIDAYVFEATVNRESTVITDPETGKKAKITYNNFSVSVKDHDKYDQLYIYVFPNKLKSYQRINGTNGKFEYPLNNSFRYDIAIVGINEKGFYYEQKVNVKQGKLKNIQLTKLSEYDLNASIEQLNSKRGAKAMNFNNELNYLFVEQENYVVQKQRKAMWEFRNIVGKTIADCWVTTYTDSQISTVELEEPSMN